MNVPLVFSLVFGLGALLAGFAGVAGGSYLSISQGEDARYLLVSLLVVIVGGLGSVGGPPLAHWRSASSRPSPRCTCRRTRCW